MRQIVGNLVGQRRPGAPAKAVLEASQLRLVGLRAGSTILEIAGASPDAGLLEFDIPTDLTEITFDMLMDGLGALVSASDEEPAELPVGFDDRLMGDFDVWLRSMRRYESVALESHVGGRVKQAASNPEAARARLKGVSPQPVMPFVSPSQQALEGKLYALNLNTGSFHVEDDAGHKIRTVLSPESRNSASLLVSRRVRAIGKPDLDEAGRIRSFQVDVIGPAPDLEGLSEQKSFFDVHELEIKPPPGDSGSIKEWAIGGLSDGEADDFMSALAEA
ncbi:hypothetical protein G7072_07915 [Nocardioides sp. HDW12B]|uniref:hypothetical protein n=1 Tax=Nocardioides sp. HDW12B TaxID=2714939 RepID=UPI00140B9EE5|nr:hypothetical protein [Nocardioides sp. HDW12B]QIK66284.1 hypothetical protein G7072_07915 [Nocardioides sp. HDW12B]